MKCVLNSLALSILFKYAPIEDKAMHIHRQKLGGLERTRNLVELKQLYTNE